MSVLETTRAADLAEMTAAVARLRPVISAGRSSAEANTRLDDSVYGAMVDAGLFAMPCARALGGREMHPADLLTVWEEVARIDPAAAWNLVMNSTIPTLAAWLPQQGVDELFDNGPTTVAAAFNPPAAATRVDGGWRVSGQVPFVSGGHHAAWAGFAFVETRNGEPVLNADTGQPTPYGGIVARSAHTMLDTWHTMGMRGTGSADMLLDDVFVPDHRAFAVGPLTDPVASMAGPLPRMFPLLSVSGEAIVSVAVAAEAVEQLRLLADTKAAAYSVTTLRDRELIQFFIGKAQSRVQAARAYLHAAATAAYDEACTGSLLSNDAKLDLQLAACFAAEGSAEALRFVHDAAGTSGIRIEAGFERLFRDAHTLSQHASKAASRYTSSGQLMFGLPNDWIFLSF